jgi:acyl transferase domain-containing protein/phosphopantetheinyl transferase
MRLENSSTDIAIIGMSALFAKAKDLRAYWQNILNKVDAVHEAADKWTGSYFDENSTEHDRIYTRKGGFLTGLTEFNPMEFGVMPNFVDGGEPDQYLALKLAREALADAGYINRAFNREKTGVIIGRGLQPNRGNMNLMHHGLVVDQTLDLLRQLCPKLDEETLQSIRKSLKASLPQFNAEIAPGMVPNVITGRIANRLDLMGPNYIVDAACASSLLAVELASKELLSGRCDMVLAGGVNASTSAQVYMIFCMINALSRSNIRPFDAEGSGTLLGEGLGILVLKRLESAERDGDRIYAVLKGVGSASDGKALGLLAPRLEGEILALQRAYESTNISPSSIGLLEAHGTGIPLGDRTEVQALSHVFGQRNGPLPSIALGTVKSMIGHCIPAAGMAGLIKMALALYHKILPPTLCDQVNPALEIEKTPFYINNESRPWIHGNPQSPRRAAVNAFGFGGINAHALLEEYTGSQKKDAKLVHQDWPTELMVFSGRDRTTLLNLIDKVRQLLKDRPDTRLAELAYTLSQLEFGSDRLAIIAKDVQELESKLSFAVEKLAEPTRRRLQTRNGIYYAETSQSGKTAFLIPGEGAQYPNMLADLCLYFPKVREWFDLLDEAFYERQHLPSTIFFPAPTTLTAEAQSLIESQLYVQNVAVEAVFVSCRALLDLLKEFEIHGDVIVGHSAGETTALTISGVARLDGKAQVIQAMREMNRIYQEMEAADSIAEGTLFTVGGIDPTTLNQLIATAPEPIYLAMDNCPNQVVLFSKSDDFDALTSYFKQAGGICTRLPFGRAIHTPLNEAVYKTLVPFYDFLDIGTGHTPLYSCATCEAFPTQPKAIRALAAGQWLKTVRFRETIEKLYNQEGVRTFIEVGPRGNLTAFVEDILRGREHLALASNSQRKSGLEQIQHLLARLFVNQLTVNLSPLYSSRNLTQVSLEAATPKVNGTQKASQMLELVLPVMRLDPDTVQAVQEKLHLEPKANQDSTVVPTQRLQDSVQEQLYLEPKANQDSTVVPTERLQDFVQEQLYLEPKANQDTIVPTERPQDSMKPSTRLQGDRISGVNGSLFMVHGNQPSAINHEQGGFPSHSQGYEPASQPFVENDVINVVENGIAHQEYSSRPEVSLEIPNDSSFQQYPENSNPYSTPSISVDSRLSILSAHFELMQEFLANQGRVMKSLHATAFANFQNGSLEGNPIQESQSFALNDLSFEEAWPLLGRVIEKNAQQLYCEKDFDIQQDIFLREYTLGGVLSQRHPELLPLPIIPFAILMEILAEAAVYLVGGNKFVTGFYNLRSGSAAERDRVLHGITLDQGHVSLGIFAQVQPSQDEQIWDVHVQLFQTETSGAANRVLVFEGDVKLSEQFEQSPTLIPFHSDNPAVSSLTNTTTYPNGLYQEQRLQVVKSIKQRSKQGIEANLQTLPIHDFFSHTQRPIFQIDAGLLDGVGQLVGYWIREQVGCNFSLPYHVRSVQLYATPLTPHSPVLCRGLMHFTSQESTEANFDLIDDFGGQVIARVEGWQDRYFPLPPQYYQCWLHPQTVSLSSPWMQQETGLYVRRIEPLPEDFLDDSQAIQKRILAHLMLNQNERDFWYSLPEKGPRRTNWLFGRIAAKDALRQWAKQNFDLQLAPVDIEVLSTDLGKPIVSCPELQAICAIPDLSISHSRGYVVAALAKPNQRIGIDIERLEYVRSDDLLGAAFSPQELELLKELPQLEKTTLLVGFWCAKEATAKALGTGLKGNPRQFQVSYYSPQDRQVIITHAGVLFQIKLWFSEGEVLAICQHPR